MTTPRSRPPRRPTRPARLTRAEFEARVDLLGHGAGAPNRPALRLLGFGAAVAVCWGIARLLERGGGLSEGQAVAAFGLGPLAVGVAGTAWAAFRARRLGLRCPHCGAHLTGGPHHAVTFRTLETGHCPACDRRLFRPA